MEETNERKGKVRWILEFLAGFIPAYIIIALLFAICMPTGGRGKELAKQALCGANLNGIGKGVVFYARENNDLYPPDLATLVRAGSVPPGILVCPSSGTERATTTLPADIEAHCDYIYVSGFDGNSPDDLILAFELPANHGQKGVNVLHADSHVKFYRSMTEFAGKLQRLNDYLAEGREAER